MCGLKLWKTWLLTHINDGHKGLSDVGTGDGLHKGLAVVDEGEERQRGGGLRDPVQEAVLRAKDGGGLHDDLPTQGEKDMTVQSDTILEIEHG